MYGVNGLRITEALIQQKRRQYPTKFSDKKIAYLRTKVGQIAYQCNSFLTLPLGVEKTANGWLANAARCGSISTIPEVLGVSVHYNGHVGIYVGNGYVVEARGTYYGVVKTRVDERPWKEWAMQPNVAYNTTESEEAIMLIVGDKGIPVYQLQSGLNALGYSLGSFKDMKTGDLNGCDGVFGSVTETAVKNLQAKHDLVPSGKVDFETYGVLTEDILKASGNLFQELEKTKKNIEQAIQKLNS
jgi:hypothetical protein